MFYLFTVLRLSAIIAHAAYYFKYMIKILIESEKSRIQRWPEKPINYFTMGLEFLLIVAIQVFLLFVTVCFILMILEFCLGT